MPRTQSARPGGWLPVGRAVLGEDHGGASALIFEHAVTFRKRGRLCTIAKVVVARPLGELVLATPYRHRQAVAHVSLPPGVLAHARACGARWWMVRLDMDDLCYALPLSEVEHAGWLHTSEGRPEWFVPLTAFRLVPWQDWRYTTETIELANGGPALGGAPVHPGPLPRPDGVQLALLPPGGSDEH